jgi:Icc-related predicted phosphoesterase
MIIVAISDVHGVLPPKEEIPDSDLVLIAGDILPVLYKKPDRLNLSYQFNWADHRLRSWLEALPTKHVVGIAGNHDWLFEKSFPPSDLPWKYLNGTSVEIDGIKIWGSPYSIRFLDWAFNVPPDDMHKCWDNIPEDTQILITHNPPYGYGDMVNRDKALKGPDGTIYPGGHIGCPVLLEKIKALPKLKLHVFGHNHSGYGQWEIDDKILANVTLLDDSYMRINKPFVWEIKI